jgi:hypothetical protein
MEVRRGTHFATDVMQCLKKNAHVVDPTSLMKINPTNKQ